jgi:DNA-binding response OmpR family regulator
VEDSVLITSALRVLLESHGWDTWVSPTLADAIGAVSAFRPDVILVDLTLPDGDGLDIVSALPREVPRPKVFVMTGRDDDATRDRCLSAGCDAVLIKPVPTRDLVELIAGAVA